MSFADSNNSRAGGNYNARPYQSSTSAGGFGGGNNNNNGNYGSAYGNSSFGGGRAPAPASASLHDPRVDRVTEKITSLSTAVSNIQKMVDNLGKPKDSQEMRARLHTLIETSRSLSRDVANSLKDFSEHINGPDDRIVYQKLTKDAQVWGKKFVEVSKTATQRERSTPIPQQPLAKSGNQGLGGTFQGGYEQAYDPEEEHQSLVEANKRQQLAQIDNERQYNDNIIQDREDAIKQIESAILDVNEMFTDLSQLVQEQGIMIDNIESHIEDTVVHTDQGVIELRKASEHQKSARSKMCCLALIIAIIGAVLTVVLILELKPK